MSHAYTPQWYSNTLKVEIVLPVYVVVEDLSQVSMGVLTKYVTNNELAGSSAEWLRFNDTLKSPTNSKVVVFFFLPLK